MERFARHITFGLRITVLERVKRWLLAMLAFRSLTAPAEITSNPRPVSERKAARGSGAAQERAFDPFCAPVMF
jgi:hypothetical protein